MKKPVITESTHYRRATREDVSLIHQLLKESAIEQGMLDEFFTTEADLLRDVFSQNPKANIFIVEYDGEAAGLTVFFYNFASFIGNAGVYIEDIFVRPAFQGKGIGKQIFKFLAQHALDEGCGLLEWMVHNENAQARRFYERMGAYAVDGWTVNRIKGNGLKKVVGM